MYDITQLQEKIDHTIAIISTEQNSNSQTMLNAYKDTLEQTRNLVQNCNNCTSTVICASHSATFEVLCNAYYSVVQSVLG